MKRALLLIIPFVIVGCAPTIQYLPKPGPVIDPRTARIRLRRPHNYYAGGAAGMQVIDNGTHVGDLGPAGILEWDRPPGAMKLAINHSDGDEWIEPFLVMVEAGKTYQLEVDNLEGLVTALNFSPRILAKSLGRRQYEQIQLDASVPKLTSYAPPPLQIPPPEGEIISLAVLDLKSIGSDDTIGPAVTDTVREALLNSRHYRVMNKASMDEILQEQDFQQSGRCDDTQCIVKVGKLLAVRKMVAGKVAALGRSYKITLELVDVETGQIEKISSESCMCPVEQLFMVAETASKRLLLPE